MKTLTRPTFLRPTTLHDAAIALTRPGAHLSAGGTAIETERAAGAPHPDLLIDLSLIEDQDFRTCTPDRIGAGVSLATIERASHLPALLRQAAASVAAPSIRRLATLGGQIGGKTGCTLPALLVLDASVIFRDQNTEHTLPLARWLAAPRGLITGISLPPLAPAALTGFRKTGFRQSFSPSAITIASLVEHGPRNRFRSIRLAAGGGPTPPARLPDTEAWLARQTPDAIDWRQFRQRVFHEIRTTGDLKRSAAWRACVAANTLALTLGGPAALPVPPEHTRHTPEPLLPLPPETELTRPASPHQRPDMAAKVHGEPHFHTDRRHTPDGSPLLAARILRSPVPHALIAELDVSEANSMPGIRAIVTARDIPGDNAYGIVRQDQPVFARDRVRYTGEAIAAIAADTPAQADAALAKIRVRYEDLPIVSDPVQALAPDAPLLHPDHPDGNLCARATIIHGDPGPVWERCAVIVEATYTTPRQMHAYMETEGGWARQRKDGILEIYAGSQYGLRDRHQLACILARDPESIRVVSGPTGGSFGGKDDLTVQPALCLLALKSGQPVSLRLERRESVIAGQKSAPFRIHMRTGCDAEGHILAHQADLIADSGAYASLSPAVLDTAVEHACGPYHIPNHHIEGRLAYTSNGVTGAFRGFGANQVNFALESQIDRLAAKLSLDPVTIRARNLRRPGDPGAFGHQVASSENVAEMLRAASASPLWTTPRGYLSGGHLSGGHLSADHLSGGHLPDRAVTAGVGMALIYQGNGLGSQLPDPAAARLRLRPDGKIEAAADLVEMGQGVVAVLQTVTARALGCTPEDVAPLAGDTDIALDSGSTSASRGSISAFLGLEGAAIPFREQLLTAASAALGRPASELRPGPGGIHSATGNNAPLMSYAELAATCPDALPEASFHSAIPAARWTRDNARFLFCGGAVIARIEFSLADGQIRVTDTELHSAAGPVLSHAGYMGQMEGALLQATGFSLMENTPFVSGHSQTQNFDSYMLPTIADIPETVRIFAYEELDPADPARSRGIGEVGMSSLAPALANAVADACGTWPEHAPFRPETLLNACGTGPHALQEAASKTFVR